MASLITPADRIFVAGHRGMAGWRCSTALMRSASCPPQQPCAAGADPPLPRGGPGDGCERDLLGHQTRLRHATRKSAMARQRCRDRAARWRRSAAKQPSSFTQPPSQVAMQCLHSCGFAASVTQKRRSDAVE
jgi:hypothetical protein